MKKFSFLALAAVGLLLGACSSDKDVAADMSTPVNEDGKQFIAMNINLPVDNGNTTRSGETNDNNYNNGSDDADHFELNDGLASEYTVNDATLVVFHPATSGKEEDATFVAAYNINPEPWKMSDDKQVTDYSTKIVQKVGTTVRENDLALVILNKNNLFGFSSANKFQVNGTDFTGTFGDLQSALATAAAGGKTAAGEMTTSGFYMANAPLTDKPGSQATPPTGATIRTLVPIENVYETEQAAREGQCAQIYVERGMAKVTLEQAISTPKLNTQYGVGVEGATAADLTLTIDGWVLDHTNTKSFMVRSTADHDKFIPLINTVANKYRYIGKSEITEGSPATFKYRTYFAKDPNYDETPFPTAFGNVISTPALSYLTDVDAALSDKFGEKNPQYCFENTFDVAHQSINNTTLVRLKVTAMTGTTGEDLYIINGNKSAIYKEADVLKLIQKKCVELYEASGVVTSSTIVGTDFVITLSSRDVDGYKNVSSIDASAAKTKVSSGTAPSDAELLASVKKAYKDNTVGSKDGSILCYVGGVSYYTIRIKHFGDQLTPWKVTGITPEPSLTLGSYPGWDGSDAEKLACDNEYLGRYGVLRNNWYDIRIKDIKYLGEAVPVDYKNDPTPDDEIEGYIAVQINILSWAKRTQQWSL